jgi:hypothetical protein
MMMLRYIYFLFFFSSTLLFGPSCQQKATIISNSGEMILKSPSVGHKIKQQLSPEKKTVVFDVRRKFDFEAFHLPGSLNFNFDEIQVRNAQGNYVLNPDLFKISRRLAHYGVEPSTQVLLIGYGPSGKGEEAAMAFYLQLLGLPTTVATSIDNFRAHPFPAHSLESVPIWKPKVFEIFSTKEQLRSFLSQTDHLVPSSKARVSALQTQMPVKAPKGLIVSEKLTDPKGNRILNTPGWSWTVQVLDPMDFVDKQGLWASENVKSRTNLGAFDLVVIQNRDSQKAMALGYVAQLGGAKKIILLEDGLN